MKLSDLKKLLEAIQSMLKKNGNFNGINSIPNAYRELQETLTNSEITLEESQYKALNLVVSDYIRTGNELHKIATYLESVILEAINKGLQEDEIINIQPLPMNHIEIYQHMGFAYANLLMAIDKTYYAINYEGVLALSAEDFAPKPLEALDILCSTTSGAFDLDTCNKKLSLQNHTLLNSNMMNIGFDVDHYCSYFVGQTILETSRNGRESGLVKCNDFINLYLEKTGLPQNIGPNLKALITTLAYQSGVAGFMCFDLFNTVYLSSAIDGDMTVLNTGAYHMHFDFDSAGKINIQYVSLSLDGEIVLGRDIDKLPHGLHIIGNLNFSISVKCNALNEPTFTIENIKKNVVCNMNKEQSKQHQWRVKKSVLSSQSLVNKKYFGFFENCLENLAKFAGYTSISDFSRKERSQEGFALYTDEFFHLLHLSQQESAFLKSLAIDYFQNQFTPEKLAKKISAFVIDALPTLSDTDKVRYVYLLKIAFDFAGNDVTEKAFSELVEALAKSPDLLLDTMKKDVNLYEMYQIKMASFFRRRGLPVFSDEQHVEVLNALMINNYSFDLLLKDPSSIVENNCYLSFLKQLPIEKQILFLNQYVEKKPGDLKYLENFLLHVQEVFISTLNLHHSMKELNDLNENITLLLLTTHEKSSLIKDSKPFIAIVEALAESVIQHIGRLNNPKLQRGAAPLPLAVEADQTPEMRRSPQKSVRSSSSDEFSDQKSSSPIKVYDEFAQVLQQAKTTNDSIKTKSVTIDKEANKTVEEAATVESPTAYSS